MSPQSITEKLIGQADKELRERIAAAVQPIDSFLRDGSAHKITLKGVQVEWYVAMEALKEKAFEANCDHNREQKIREFMAQVFRLGSEIDDLRESINQ